MTSTAWLQVLEIADISRPGPPVAASSWAIGEAAPLQSSDFLLVGNFPQLGVKKCDRYKWGYLLLMAEIWLTS